jgi:IS30 family transposase
MKQFAHLTQTKRYQISSLLKTSISQSEIARIIGCHKSTISVKSEETKENEAIAPHKHKEQQPPERLRTV